MLSGYSFFVYNHRAMLDLIIKIQERLEKWFLALSPVKKKAVCVSACLLGIVLVSIGSEVVWYLQNAEFLAHMESQGEALWTTMLVKRFGHFFATVTTLSALSFFAFILTRKEAAFEDSENITGESDAK